MTPAEKMVNVRSILDGLGGLKAFGDMWSMVDAVMEQWKLRHPDVEIDEDEIIQAAVGSMGTGWGES